MSLHDMFIETLSSALQRRCINPDIDKINKVLKDKGINTPYAFGCVYKGSGAMGLFTDDYFKEIMIPIVKKNGEFIGGKVAERRKPMKPEN